MGLFKRKPKKFGSMRDAWKSMKKVPGLELSDRKALKSELKKYKSGGISKREINKATRNLLTSSKRPKTLKGSELRRFRKNMRGMLGQ